VDWVGSVLAESVKDRRNELRRADRSIERLNAVGVRGPDDRPAAVILEALPYRMDDLTSSDAAARSLAENYVGLPF